MPPYGYDAQFVIANNPHSQHQWLRENNELLLNQKNWIYEIARRQVDRIRPDVLYLTDGITFDSRFVRTLSWKPRLIIGWRAASIPNATNWSDFDVILSHLRGCREKALKLGARSSEHFFPGFPKFIADTVKNENEKWDVVFSGQCTPEHQKRNSYLGQLAKAPLLRPESEFSIGYFISSSHPETLPAGLAMHNQGARWGMEMFRTLKQGRVVLNAEIDLAKGEAGNMRLFETTGVGAFLLTEYHDNIRQYFEPGKELEVFRNGDELVDKIRYYLGHPEERKAIARQGQERCLREYSIEKRAEDFDRIIRNHLSKKLASPHSSPSFSAPRNRDGRKHVIVASHRRSGTHLTIDTIINNFPMFSNNPEIGKVTLDSLVAEGKQHRAIDEIRALTSQGPCVLKTHAHGDIGNFFLKSDSGDFIDDLFSNSKIIYVHRDGRDVLTSLYYYMQNFDEEIKKVPFNEFIRMTNKFDEDSYNGELNRVEYWQFHVRSWLDRKNVLFLSFNDFFGNLHNTLTKISRFIELPFNPQVKDVKLAKGKHQDGVKHSSVCFRKGKSGDWKEHFGKDDSAYFDLIAGKTNRLLKYHTSDPGGWEFPQGEEKMGGGSDTFYKPHAATDMNGNAYAVIEQAVDRLNKNNNADALSLLDRAISAKPELRGLAYGKAVALARLGRMDEAIDALKSLLSAEPNHQKAQVLLNAIVAALVPGLMKGAVDALNANRLNEAFSLLNKAKFFKKPFQGLDFLRAIYFLRTNQPVAARESLLEELRYFQNAEAKKLLDQILDQHPQLTSPKIDDTEFRELLGTIRPYTMLSEERLFSLYSLAKRVCVEDIPGNFVECGVAAGGSTALLATVIRRYSKRVRWHYAFDSFEGMPQPTAQDKDARGIDAEATGWGTGTCSAPEESVKEICAKLGVSEIVKPVKGYFEATLPRMRNHAGMIALLHMDGDWYESTKAILHNLYDHVVNNGFVQVDDYGYWQGCKKAIHEFESSRNIHFEINQIDGTGVWFRKPDKFPVNESVPASIVEGFHRTDPACQNIESQMSQNERFQLYYAARELLPAKSTALRFVEIGSWAGASLQLIHEAIKQHTPNVRGFTIEPGGRPQFYEVIKRLENEVAHLRMLSHQAAPQLKQMFEKDGNYPGFMFIDGSHTYEGVRQDIIDFYPLLAPGGLMVFHDFLPPLNDENREAILFHHGGKEPGIRQACEELMEKTYHCEVVDMPLLYPDDPTQTQPHLPIIPGVFSTIRVYRKK